MWLQYHVELNARACNPRDSSSPTMMASSAPELGGCHVRMWQEHHTRRRRLFENPSPSCQLVPCPLMPFNIRSVPWAMPPGTRKNHARFSHSLLLVKRLAGPYYRISPTRVNNNLFDASPLPFQGLGGTTCERVPVHVCVTKVQPSLRFQLRPSGDQARQSDQLHFDTSFIPPKTKRTRASSLHIGLNFVFSKTKRLPCLHAHATPIDSIHLGRLTLSSLQCHVTTCALLMPPAPRHLPLLKAT